jgi:hypothetical protein
MMHGMLGRRVWPGPLARLVREAECVVLIHTIGGWVVQQTYFGDSLKDFERLGL